MKKKKAQETDFSEIEAELQEKLTHFASLVVKAHKKGVPTMTIALTCDLKVSISGTYSSTGVAGGVPAIEVPVTKAMEAFDLLREIANLQLAMQFPDMLESLKGIRTQ